ncbi:MAG: NADH-quinone oxidoreductase subunit C [Deltaproteobacteria bacterium]|nr:NADH-quinone oxidoreductase subunit C [Deltaproteobacteria bacterium]
MFEEQEIIDLTKEEMLKRVRGVFDEGYRLVQIGCTRGETYQIDYTFDKAYKFLDLRINVPLDDPELPSITGIYDCAFVYENEIHDLFGIKVAGINVDYKGKFYRIPVKAPFSTSEAAQGEPRSGKE